MSEMDKKYDSVLKHLVDKINGSRQKIARVVNNELLSAYWEIGRTLLEQKEKEGWGNKIIERLAKDLKAEFPQMNGLSQRNLEYMQTFAEAWPFFPFTQQPVAQLRESEKGAENLIPQPLVAELAESNKSPIVQPSAAQLTRSEQNAENLIVQQPVAQLTEYSHNTENPIPQPTAAELQDAENKPVEDQRPVLALIPWTHHMIILDKLKTLGERIFYLKKVIENGWTKNLLTANIETDLYSRIGKAITNFDSTLSKNEAELVRLTLKNPYMFDFLGRGGSKRT